MINYERYFKTVSRLYPSLTAQEIIYLLEQKLKSDCITADQMTTSEAVQRYAHAREYKMRSN